MLSLKFEKSLKKALKSYYLLRILELPNTDIVLVTGVLPYALLYGVFSWRPNERVMGPLMNSGDDPGVTKVIKRFSVW